MLATACGYLATWNLPGKWRSADGKQDIEIYKDGTVVLSSTSVSLRITAHYKLLTSHTVEIEVPSRIKDPYIHAGTNAYIRNLDAALEWQHPNIVVRFAVSGDKLTIFGDKNSTNVLTRVKP